MTGAVNYPNDSKLNNNREKIQRKGKKITKLTYTPSSIDLVRLRMNQIFFSIVELFFCELILNIPKYSSSHSMKPYLNELIQPKMVRL